MVEQDVVVNNETKIYYNDCRVWLNRLKSKVMHHQIMINARYTVRESGNHREMFLQEQENRSLFYNMVNFRKEVRISNCTTRGRTNYDSWKRTLAVPGAVFAQLNYLQPADQDLLNRLSFRGKTLTG